MENWKEFFNTLAGKLTAILAFAILVLVLISWFGVRIPAAYETLIYVVVIGAMVIFALQAILEVRAKGRISPSETLEPPSNTEAETPPKSETAQSQMDKPVKALSKEESYVAYLEAVVADNRPLRLAGLDEHAGDPNRVRLSLEKIYVALSTTTQIEEEIKKREPDPLPREETHPLPVIEALQKARNRRMVLLGFPGTGKSTFVRYLALMMAQELSGTVRQVEEWDGQPLLPVALSLGRFAESLPPDVQKGRAEYLEDFMLDTLKSDERTAGFAPHFTDHVQKRGALFLFDGLDEVADLELRPVVVQAIEAFVRGYRGDERSYFLVTCRTYSYQDPRWKLTDWEQHELALLDDGQISQFVTAWYEQHTLLDKQRANEYAQKREKLLVALHPSDRRQLYKVARYPIILTVMAVVHASYELPDSRAQVYAQCVDLLLEKWNAKRSIMGLEQMRNILAELDVPRSIIDQALWEIAYEAHRGREDESSGGLVTEKLVSGVMTEYLRVQEKVQVFLDFCERSNGLLMLQGVMTSGRSKLPRRVYTFPHLTFEEYLAARYLDGEGGDILRALLDDAFDRWYEVSKLLAEHLCFANPDRGRMNDILEALAMPKSDPRDEKDWRALWLAGELLVLYKRAFPKKSPFEDEIHTGLRALLDAAALQPRQRADAADALDELGYLPADLHRLVPIVGGDGSAAYHIARYPVTNAQYRRFVEAPDFAEREYWVDFPKFSEPEKETGAIEAIGDWGDEGWIWLQSALKDEETSPDGKVVLPRYWHSPRLGIARAGVPVVGITWFEASAYGKWLLAHWEQLPEKEQNPVLKPGLIRLPSEVEWVAAAGGDEPGDRFPWDVNNEVTQDEAGILNRANVFESGIGRTTPVGMYALGASPRGVWDMGGNVWEWQANYYRGDRDYLALRGGSWFDDHIGARLSGRYVAHPHSLWSHGGFRVVALPS